MSKYMRDGRAPIPESETTSRVMSANIGRGTKPELTLRRALRQIGLLGYRLHWKKVPGRPDIAYARKKVAIFVHGCFWHRCPHCNLPLPKSHTNFWRNKFERNKERDEQKIRELEVTGWYVIVVWECQIKNDLSGVVKRIKETLTDR